MPAVKLRCGNGSKTWYTYHIWPTSAHSAIASIVYVVTTPHVLYFVHSHRNTDYITMRESFFVFYM